MNIFDITKPNRYDPALLGAKGCWSNGTAIIRPVGIVSFYKGEFRQDLPLPSYYEEIDVHAVMFVQPPDMTFKILLERKLRAGMSMVFPRFSDWERGMECRIGGMDGGLWCIGWEQVGASEVGYKTDTHYRVPYLFSTAEMKDLKERQCELDNYDIHVPGIVERYLKKQIVPKKELAVGMTGTPADFDAMMKKKHAARFRGIA